MQITARELSALLNGKVEGDDERIVTKPAKIEEATKNCVSFIANPKYEKYAGSTKASVLIVSDTFQCDDAVKATLIRVDDPYRGFSRILELFNQEFLNKSGIEPSSHIAASAKVGEDIYIGAFSYLDENVEVGNNTKIFPGCYLGDQVKVGDNTIIYPGVKVYHTCQIGNNCIIHAGAVIGSDGFGFTPNADGSFGKIPQTGNVVIEDNVEIGANTTIDRATMGSTIICKGAKLDNLIQVAHNVEIGENTAIAAQAGISGSTKLGRHCMIGGQVGFVGHLSIADGTRINAQSGVARSIKKKGASWNGTPAFDYHSSLKSQVIFRNLPELEKRVRELEQELEALKSQSADD